MAATERGIKHVALQTIKQASVAAFLSLSKRELLQPKHEGYFAPPRRLRTCRTVRTYLTVRTYIRTVWCVWEKIKTWMRRIRSVFVYVPVPYGTVRTRGCHTPVHPTIHFFYIRSRGPLLLPAGWWHSNKQKIASTMTNDDKDELSIIPWNNNNYSYSIFFYYIPRIRCLSFCFRIWFTRYLASYLGRR